ncbi:MAG: ribokinase [Actinomycetota bacterium]|jgi:ribokinase
MTGHVCVVGSANLDLIALAQRLPNPGETVIGHGFVEAAGGKGLNQAVAAARAGATVSFIGAVGNDDAGRALRQVAIDDGINTSGLVTVAGSPTGRALIGVSDDGANLIIVVPGANAAVDRSVVEAAERIISSADVVLGQHEVPDQALETAFRLARQAGATTILNPAPAHPIPASLLGLVDILVPNEHEYPLLGDVSSVGCLVVTEGEQGCRLVREGQSTRIPAFAVEAVDTVAAGDAFCGALAATLAQGEPLETALLRASAAGALATLTHGAVPSLPDAAAIDWLIARG